MIRLLGKATLFAAMCLTAANAVMAGVPNSAASIKPSAVIMVTKDPTLPLGAAAAIVQYTVKDAANNNVANSVVTINMTGCLGTEIKLCDTQPLVVLNCGAKTVSATTNASGVAVFRILGRIGVNPGFATGKVSGCATVTADGVPFGSVNVAVADLDGAGGCGPADGSLFLADRDNAGSPKNQARSDYNGVGGVNPADGSIFLQLRDFSATDASANTDCP